MLALGETFTGDTPVAEAGVVDGVAEDTETDTAGSEATLEVDWVTGGLVEIGVDSIGGGGDTEDDCAVVLAGGAAGGVTVGRELAVCMLLS